MAEGLKLLGLRWTFGLDGPFDPTALTQPVFMIDNFSINTSAQVLRYRYRWAIGTWTGRQHYASGRLSPLQHVGHRFLLPPTTLCQLTYTLMEVSLRAPVSCATDVLAQDLGCRSACVPLDAAGALAAHAIVWHHRNAVWSGCVD